MLRRLLSPRPDIRSILIASTLSIPTTGPFITVSVRSVIVVIIMLASFPVPCAVFLACSGSAATAGLWVVAITAGTRFVSFCVCITPRLHLCLVGRFGVRIHLAPSLFIPNRMRAATLVRAGAVMSRRGIAIRATAARWRRWRRRDWRALICWSATVSKPCCVPVFGLN